MFVKQLLLKHPGSRRYDVDSKDLIQIISHSDPLSPCYHLVGDTELVPSYLNGAIGIQKQVLAADAAVDAAQGHVEAEGKEVAMVEMSHAVVQPS